jgi:hypothetical protein
MRIDPLLSLVWRTPETVQVGFPVAVVTATLTPAQEHLLVALRSGSNASALYGLARTLGITRAECDSFVDTLRPAFAPVGRSRLRVGVDGSGQTAVAIARLLATSCDVRSVNAASVSHRRLAVDRRLSRAARERAAKAESLEPTWRPDVVVLVDTYAVTSARCGVWLRREIPHLSVIIGDTVSRVGPFVRPGDGPCLSCVEMNAIDADNSRPAILAQLLGKPSGGESALVSAELAAVVARAVLAGESEESSLAVGEALELDSATGLWTGVSISTCSRCSCRALPGIETTAVA